MTPKKLTLKRKVEIGLTTFLDRLKAINPTFKKYRSYQGSQADDRKLPSYLVDANGSEEAFPFGPKKVTVEILIVTQIDDNDEGELPSPAQRRKVRARHDMALEIINEALDGNGAVAALQQALNFGAHQRPIEGFHLYDLTKQDERHAFADRCFIDSLTFSIICEADDCLADRQTADETEITADSTQETADLTLS